MDNHESPVPQESVPPPKNNNGTYEAEAVEIKLNAILELEELSQLEKEVADKKVEKKISEKKHDEIKKKRADIFSNVSKLLDYAGRDVKVTENPQQQTLLKGISQAALEGNELVNLFVYLNDYLLGDKNIILMSTDSVQKSDFELKLMNLMEADSQPAIIMINELIKNAQVFGKEPTEINERFQNLMKKFYEQDRRTINDEVEQYFPHYTEDKKDFIRRLNDPNAFLDLINIRVGEELKDTSELEEKLKKTYQKQYGSEPDPAWLETLVERQIYIEVSEGITKDIGEILREIYRQLAIERGEKAFETVQSDDFMHGIMVTKNIISRALHGLESNFRMMEEADPKNIDPRLLRMYKLTQEDSYTQELNYDGNIRPKPRTKPLAYFKQTKMSEFITGQWANFFHWEHATGFFHNIGLVYKEDPHEGGFYSGLKRYAARMTSVDLDGFYCLPQGPLTIEAYHLFEKFTQEAYAKIDWKIQADMNTVALESINTQIENKVIEYLMLNHQGENMSETAFVSAVNNAVGLASGVYLSAPENIAYADAEFATQSYGTLDATPEVVFNMMHFFMRWGGPALLNPVFFLEADGVQPGFWKSLLGVGGWDHRVAMENANTVRDSLFNLKRGRESEMMNLIIDKFLHLTKTADFINRGGWRNLYTLSPHFEYDDKGNLRLLDSFKSMDVIGFEAVNWFLRNVDGNVNISKNGFLEKTELTDVEIKKLIEVGLKENKPVDREKLIADNQELINQREGLFKYLYERYFETFAPEKNGHKVTYEEYINELRPRAEKLVKDNVKKNHNMPFENYDKAVQKKISELFIEGAMTRVVAARFPTKFFRIDKDRFHYDGVGLWRQMYDQMKKDNSGLTRDQFSSIMSDLEFVEGVIREDASKEIKEVIHLLPLNDSKDRSLGDHVDLLQTLNKDKIREILESKGLEKDRIKKVEELYDLIYKKMIGKSEKKHDKNGKIIDEKKESLDFLDGEAVEAIKRFPFNLGLEDTDFSLVVYRAAGPNMIKRSIGDVASMEDVVIKGFFGIPEMFRQISISGDTAPFIKYLKDCQKVFHDVHGVPDDYKFNDMLCGMLINYMRRDDNAVPGGINSIAAQMVSDSNLVRDWDGRNIDKFLLTIQQEGLLPKHNYDTTYGPKYENVWKIDKKGNPIRTESKKIVEEYEHTTEKNRKKFGGDWKNMLVTALKHILPLASIWLLWQYLKKAFEETFGAKKG